MFVKDNSHLLQGVATCFRIQEIHRDFVDNQNTNEYKVILPTNGVQGDWVDKCIENVAKHNRDPGDGEPARTELEWPHLTGIGS